MHKQSFSFKSFGKVAFNVFTLKGNIVQKSFKNNANIKFGMSSICLLKIFRYISLCATIKESIYLLMCILGHIAIKQKIS